MELIGKTRRLGARRAALALPAAALAAGAALAGSPAQAHLTRGTAGARTSAAARVPDVTKLIPRATRKVRTSSSQLRGAVLYEADGYTRGKTATRRAAGIVRWLFVFDNPTAGSKYPAAAVFYGPPPHRFSSVKVSTTPYLEDQVIPRRPRLTLAQAVRRLRRAGYRQPFTSVVLRYPLYPGATVQYIFTLPKSYVGVNAYNGKVRKD